MNDATRRQISAADPQKSSWVAANAGSGKTRVLIDRVARLLLEGVRPEFILCLTFTKAAASEMQNRLFDRLGKWAMMPGDILSKELSELGVSRDITDLQLAQARRLFANAIEAPGGLKIQTIHSFCASILRKFPLEAGVSPQFTEMEETAARELRHLVVANMISGEDRQLVEDVAAHITDGDFTSLTEDILKNKASIKDQSAEYWCQAFGIRAQDLNLHDLLQDLLQPADIEFLQTLVEPLLLGSKNDQKLADRLRQIQGVTWQTWELLESAFLTGSGSKVPFSAKIGSVPTKASQSGALAPFMDDLNDLMTRVQDGRSRRVAAMSAIRTQALNSFGARFLENFKAEKQKRAVLDYDDLIDLTSALLDDSSVAQWVLYRLDGGISHLLVDEAQDTSPSQWRVISRLTEEMTAGQGSTRTLSKSLFVVGDPKQSIYSFQGADPTGFTRMRGVFSDRMAEAQRRFVPLELEYSFRSAPPILDLVDKVYELEGAQGMGGPVLHRAFRTTLPGRVDLWPMVPPPAKEEDLDWTDPVDRLSEVDETVVLARQIADEIAGWLANKVGRPAEIAKSGQSEMRPIEPKDILILVRRRSALFEEIIRACKVRGIPIAGADRLKLLDVLAVRDVLSLLAFLSNQDDDLALAEALKSPLFGWSERELFQLAVNREDKPLWQSLREQSETYSAAFDLLTKLRNRADFLRPYELIEYLLTNCGGRAKLIGRLGIEAEDGLNALLTEALSFESKTVPTITAFLDHIFGNEIEIKRQFSTEANELRVMTVHGAKGLEAPIVILPDCAERRVQKRGSLLESNGEVFWPGNAQERPVLFDDALEKERALELEELDRLFYVAMTRAENWLIVAATGDPEKQKSSWHKKAETALTALGATPLASSLGEGLRLENAGWDNPVDLPPAMSASSEVEPPQFGDLPAINAPVVLNPSQSEGPKALPGDAGLDFDPQFATDYGSAVHALLDRAWASPSEMTAYLDAAFHKLPEDLQMKAQKEAKAVLNARDLSPYFASSTHSEIKLTAKIPELGGARVTGVVDRLIVEENTVIAADFKTNRVVPRTAGEVPEGLLRQMGLYAMALQQIYPDHDIRLILIWTKTRTTTEVPLKMVRGLLQTPPTP